MATDGFHYLEGRNTAGRERAFPIIATQPAAGPRPAPISQN